MSRIKRAAQLAVFIFAPLVCVGAPYQASVRIVEVGDGLCTYTVVPTGAGGALDDDAFIMVYDAGSGSACTESIKANLGYAVSEIDLLIISHNAWPHFGGATFLLRDFDVREIWHSGESEDSVAWRAFADAVSREVENGAKLRLMSERAVSSGERRFITPDTYLSAYFGPGRWEWGGLDGDTESKARSIVIQLTAGQSTVLFTGDIVGRDDVDGVDACRHAEGLLVKDVGDQLRSTILLVPNHGRTISSTPCFLEAVSPTYAVLSAAAPKADTAIPAIYASLSNAGVDPDRIFSTNWVRPVNDDEKQPGQPGCMGSDIQIYLYLKAPAKIGHANPTPIKCAT